MMKRLLVLQHLEREGLGLLSRIAQERGLIVSIFRLDLGDSLPELAKGDLVLILGGPMGIRDINHPSFPWLLDEIEFIKEALNKQVGIIGICLGAQLLAYASGGYVEALLGGTPPKPLPEVGWDTVSKSPGAKTDSLSSLLAVPLPVLHWHGDRILLPSDAELIASSSRCKEQFFKIGSLAYGMQFHIEIEDEMVFKWIEEDSDFIRSGLGVDARFVLEEQQKEFGDSTLQSRLMLLEKLFDLISA
ncbi:GMP synthase - Glutamine amidotransferase domain [Prochlorococcus marinus str. MIT 9211]|uniref:GMP synthase-Glutamine amidotransferase domain n=2 Tax=Prochlorococcus marinus TaxID=1219 RepID=A9B9P3_PROM4|nr:GMP synthase - Glutamine amidotransferase domain [Prochlorococcus marinus str. MIT 9211]